MDFVTWLNDKQAARFLELNPTRLDCRDGVILFEHPVRGDAAPIYIRARDGRIGNTGCYDIESVWNEIDQI